MPKITPFLWFNADADEAVNFYLSVFPDASKISELRSKGVGPWPEGTLAVATINLLGQQMTFMNGGPGHPQTDAFSFTITCKDQQEIDYYWSKLTDGGREIQCGWLQDKFGVFWQVTPQNIGPLISTPKGMEAMMKMKKFDIAALEAAAKS